MIMTKTTTTTTTMTMITMIIVIVVVAAVVNDGATFRVVICFSIATFSCVLFYCTFTC